MPTEEGFRKVVLPVPPSDNRRLIIQHNRAGQCLHRMILSKEARDYLKEAMLLLKAQWPKDLILVPTYRHQLHILVKAWVRSWRGDCSNFTKLLKDTLSGTIYDDDKFVHVDYLDSEKDEKNPRLECYVSVDPFSVGTPRQLPEERSTDGCRCLYYKLLLLGWLRTGITHHPKCPANRTRLGRHDKHATRGHSHSGRGKT